MRSDHDRIGRVVSVAGSELVFLHDKRLAQRANGSAESVPAPQTNGSANGSTNGSGSEATPLQIGSLVKMETPGSTVFGMVSGLTIPVPDARGEDGEMRIVELELLGESLRNGSGPAGFQRGVSVFPSLGDEVYATGQSDLSLVYARPEKATVSIGAIHQDSDLPAYILTDDLLGRHFAILGTTGAGKSCAIALILRAILETHRNAHILLLDPHNEYARTFGDSAEVLNPDNLQLPYWLLNFEEMVEVVLGNESGDTAAAQAILHESIAASKKQFQSGSEEELTVTVDTPVPYRLTDLLQNIDENMGKLEKAEDTAPYLKLKNRLNALRADKRFAFMFGGLSIRDNMADILSRILRIPVDDKPVTIMDLSGVPSEILNVVVSVLCRIAFDFGLYSERAVPILLVCEEAHRYAPQDSEAGFEPTKRALSRIAKEGRKYGVSLCVVSQRPSELATGMLSQCNTIFAMRLTNQKDQDFVRSAMSDNALGITEFLPSLHNAEAIAVGEGVPVPVRLTFDTLPEEVRPQSGTAAFSESWQNESQDKDFLKQVVARWRRQRR